MAMISTLSLSGTGNLAWKTDLLEEITFRSRNRARDLMVSNVILTSSACDHSQIPMSFHHLLNFKQADGKKRVEAYDTKWSQEMKHFNR